MSPPAYTYFTYLAAHVAGQHRQRVVRQVCRTWLGWVLSALEGLEVLVRGHRARLVLVLGLASGLGC